MKSLISAIVLLSSVQYAFADTTLTYGAVIGDDIKKSATYKIKNGVLRLIEPGSGKINLYNHKKHEFNSFNPANKKSSTINKELIDQRISRLNKERLEKLEIVEKNLDKELKDRSDKEQQAGQSLINQMRYPELYGEHTSLSVKPDKQSRVVNNIQCNVYKLYKQSTLKKEFCLASPKNLGISSSDYEVIRGLYKFDYETQSRLLLASGKSSFLLIDYDKYDMDGIVIEIASYRDKKVSHRLQLTSFNSNTISETELLIPDS